MISLPSQERIKQSHILILEDDRLTVELLRQHLSNAGYRNLHIAYDGLEGLAMLARAKPDIIILDILMPNMDGYEFTRKLREDPSYSSVPIIFQTVLDDADNKLRAFGMGATDYIAKPLNQAELLARLQVHLLNKLLIEELVNAQRSMNEELLAAREMQDRLQPSAYHISMAERLYHMNIAHHFETSSRLGGDCWGIRSISPHRLAISIFDLSGHGISAAMNVFRMHTLMQDQVHLSDDPGAFLTSLSRAMHRLFERNEFATMFYGVIDTVASSLQYAVAASPPAMIFSNEDEPEILNGCGFPLGAKADAQYDTMVTPFMPGSSLLLFSDCLIETGNEHKQFLDESTIAATVDTALRSNPENPAQAAIEQLLSLFRLHSSAPLRDDLTMALYCKL